MAGKDQYAENEKTLWKSIKAKDIGCLYLFYGQEEYLKRNYTEQIDKAILSDDFRLLNKVVLEGKVSPAAIIDNCETTPVFSERKLVIVKNSGIFKGGKKTEDAGKKSGEGKKAGAGKKAGGSDELSELLSDMPGHACLVFLETEIDKRIKYVDLVDKCGLIVEFNFKKPDELTEWVMKRLKELGHEADPSVAAMIVEYGETGMDDLYNEIKKLSAYAGDRVRVTAADVAKVCTKSVKSKVFDLTDAIAAGKCAKALALLNDMEALKEPMPKVMYMIARQFRQLLQIKLLVKDGATQGDIAAHFKVPPFIAGKLLGQAKSFTVEKLENAIASGLELDLAIKTGRLGDKAAVELMITGLS
ncbi:MAG TPA: DNA polymerase III subunit delta [Clostridia bacterium]|nr:DNA polymerase III subunit delta [Clostridia bacterium]